MSDLATTTASWADAIWREALAPERQLTVSQWANAYRQLPPTSAEPGRWKTERVPYLGEIMDCLSTASQVERVVFMAGAQVGKTEAGLNWIGYVIDHAPGMMLLVMPSLDMLKRNSRTRIDPLINDTPALKAKVAAPKTREKGNTIAMKSFVGGELVMTGANAPTGLRSTPVRYIFLDEVDGYPVDADGEGDPVELAIRRTATYAGKKKIYLCSTPTLSGVSRIEKAYAESDQRKFFVPCPHCGALQVIAWARIKWPEGEPLKATMTCEHCGEPIEERHKLKMLAQGQWQATKDGDGRTAGFWLPGLYSPFETWGEMAAEFLTVKSDPPRLQTFVNTRLGEAYEDRDTAPIEAERLLSRCEPFGEILPDEVALITAGVDTQDDRLELEIVGWGKGEESWSLDYQVLWGDPAFPEVWKQLDAVLLKRYPHVRDVPPLPISAVAIDSGGHRTPNVMEYVQPRQNRRVWAIKGRGGPGIPAWPKRPPKLKAGQLAPLYIVGVDSLKHTLISRLRIEAASAGYCHFPEGRDLDYFRGITAEKPVRVYKGGVAKIKWVADSGVRNEPLDCRIYASAALHGLAASGVRVEQAVKALGEKAMRKEDCTKLRSPNKQENSAANRRPQRRQTVQSSWLG
ncbi:phage terminase large subunit family protein [Pseudovibrio sp. Alg231-02]|uniref:phage terminase large subunit family protein n=1 Tax=Pseudovibrio sp. Alg231-02 TaxID=1922223 RepID=UPI000D554959|nr:phage terminase large subunit family protein [Pseudovibrio sp. Alg231-02]